MMRKYKKKSNLVNNTGYTPGYASENNPINYIPSENITMRNTPYPVYGQPLDQNGMAMDNPTYMEPGNEYKFGGASYVAEVPAYKDGGQKSDWISEKIGILMREGRPQKQAIAIAYSMWNQKHEMGGTQLPMMQDAGWYKNNPAGMQTNFGQTTPNWYQNNPAGMQTNFGQSPTQQPQSNSLATAKPDYNKMYMGMSTADEKLKQPIDYNKEYMNMSLADEKLKPLTTDGGAAARENAGGFGITQFANPYGDVGMEDALGFSGQQFAKGNTGMGIAGAALGALKGTKSFLQGMGAQKRQNQIMKGYAEDQRKTMTGEGREQSLAYGGYFQDAGTYRDELPLNMALKNPQFAEQRRKLKNKTGQEEVEPIMEVNPVFGPQNREYDDSEQITEYSDPNEMTDEQAASFMDMYNKDQTSQKSTSARDAWEQKTGMPWAEAKRLGYTSGTAQDNTKLLSELNDPRFKKENLRSKPVAGTPAKSTPRKADKKVTPAKTAKDFTYQDFQNAMKGKPKYSGNQGNIGVADDGTMISRVGERLANPVQTLGNYAKYGELPAEGFSKNSKNAYDQVLGVANPLYWANALGNAADYAGEGEYKKAAIEALDAAPALGKLKYVRYLPLPGKVPGLAQTTSKGLQVVNKVGSAVGPARRAAPLRNYFTPELSAGAQNAQLGQGVLRLGQGAPRLGQGTAQTGQLSFGFGNGGFFQEGGQKSPTWYKEGKYKKAYEESDFKDDIDRNKQPYPEDMDFIDVKVNKKSPTWYKEGIYKKAYEESAFQDDIDRNKQPYPEDDMDFIDTKVNKKLNKQQMEDIWGKATNFAPNFMQSYYQEGGMQSEMGEQGEVPQQAGGDQMQAITQEVATMLQQGADPQQVLQQLVEAGIPQEQAQQIIEMVMGQTQGGQQEATPQLRRGGYYQEGGEAMDEEMEGEDEGTEGETPSMEQLEGQVEQALKQGADPQELLQQLVEMGVPEEQAVQMIQEILQEIQGGETEMEAPEQPMMKSGGEYLAALKGRTIKNYTYNKNTGNYDVEFE
jgi:hypothetical protein